MYQPRYRIRIRHVGRHEPYRTVASNLTASQVGIHWRSQTAFNGYRAQLLEFDGYVERVLATRDERGERFSRFAVERAARLDAKGK